MGDFRVENSGSGSSGTITGALSLTGIITPTTLSTTPNNNYNPTGLSTASVIRLTSSANVEITGLQGGTEGRIITLFNANTNSFYMDLRGENGLSTAANRFKFIDGYASTADCYLNPNQSVTLQYSGTLSRWVAFGSPLVFGPGFAVTSMPFTVSSYGALANTGTAMTFNQSNGLISIQNALTVGTYLTVTDHIIGPVTVQPTNPANRILVLKGAPSQSGNYAEFHDSNGVAFSLFNGSSYLGLGTVNPAAAIHIFGSGLPTQATRGLIVDVGAAATSNTEWRSGGTVLDKIDAIGNAGFGQSALSTDYKVSINPDTLTVGDPSNAAITINYLTAPTSASGTIVDSPTGNYQMIGNSHTARFFNYYLIGAVKTYDPNYSQSATVTDTPTNYTIGDPSSPSATINYGSGTYAATANTYDFQITSYWTTPTSAIVYGPTQVFTSAGADDSSSNPYTITLGLTDPGSQTPDGYIVQRQVNSAGWSFYINLSHSQLGTSQTYIDDGVTGWIAGLPTITPTSIPHNYYISWNITAGSPTSGTILSITDSAHGYAYDHYVDFATYLTGNDGDGGDWVIINGSNVTWVAGNPETNAFYTANTNTHEIEVFSKRATGFGTIFSSGNSDSGIVTTDASLRAYYLANSWAAGSNATAYRVLVSNSIAPYSFDHYYDSNATSFNEGNDSTPGWSSGSTVTPISVLQGGLKVIDGGIDLVSGSIDVESGTVNLDAFTQNSVLFVGASGAVSENNSKLSWDDSAFRFKIGRSLFSGTSTEPALTVEAVAAQATILDLQNSGGFSQFLFDTTNGLTFGSSINMVFNTSFGTKIGTATNQKFAFYGSTPIVQPTGSIKTALTNLGLVGSPTITLSSDVTGTLPIANGGTNATSQGSANIMYFDGTSITGSTTLTYNGTNALTLSGSSDAILVLNRNSFSFSRTCSVNFQTSGSPKMQLGLLNANDTDFVLNDASNNTLFKVIDAGTTGDAYITGNANVASLTASRAVQTDASKNLQSSSVTTTELGYLSGVTSAIQTQLAAIRPKVVASTFEKAETGTDANILTYATGGSDEFLNIQVATDVSAITGTSIVVTITWKDSNNATATSTLTLTAIGDGTINIPINSKASQNVVVSSVFVGVSTAYNISAFITKLN